ncbi:GDP-mannose 4,6-dehydratase [Halomonas sp. ANAO-440]|uniref:GDP-mannose 4,6-dehydratase n=1 Tax=Halomonas sp. ANAO-440 TaxID=2861360 RepID=UPI001CAA6F69|nr:GDP-mannose 4,6-dehydratase [Halomonas sp. ANAO-440]MBZ0329357.1 GDP-mannose 4,6-dehydratase [Halomonas sp. ANAO-440]
MPTCLVTGGSGFTGRHLIALLKQRGHRVVATASQPCGADVTAALDLGDREALAALVQRERPERVFHLAALSFVGHPRPLDFYRVNVLGTETLLEVLDELDSPPRVLLSSSANVYGANAREVIDEAVVPAPVNHYAASKLAMEHMARNHAERLPMLIARPFNYTGPGQAEQFLIPKIVAHFRRRDASIELGNLDVSRDFSDVRDLVTAYADLLEQWPVQAASGDVVNLCGGEATPLRQLIEELQALAGYEIEVRVNPAFVRKSEIPRLCGDPARLHRWWRGRPSYTLADTLRDMLHHDQG